MNKKFRHIQQRLIALQIRACKLSSEMHEYVMEESSKGNKMGDENNAAIQVHLASTQLALALQNPAFKK